MMIFFPPLFFYYFRVEILSFSLGSYLVCLSHPLVEEDIPLELSSITIAGGIRWKNAETRLESKIAPKRLFYEMSSLVRKSKDGKI